MIQHATNENYKDLVSSAKVVLVDFWAQWCGPCKMLGPIVEAVADKYEGKVLVVKCDVDDCEDVAVDMGIRGIPTLVYYRNGAIQKRSSGLVSQNVIEAELAQLL